MRQAADASRYTPQTGRAHPCCVSPSRNHADKLPHRRPDPSPTRTPLRALTSTTRWDDPTRLYVCQPTTPVDYDSAIITTQCTSCQYPRCRRMGHSSRPPSRAMDGPRPIRTADSPTRADAPHTPDPASHHLRRVSARHHHLRCVSQARQGHDERNVPKPGDTRCASGPVSGQHTSERRRGAALTRLRTGFKKIGTPGCVPGTRRWIAPDRLARATARAAPARVAQLGPGTPRTHRLF